MRLFALSSSLLIFSACRVGPPLETGAYLVMDGQNGSGLQGVNLDLDGATIRLVFEEFAEDRDLEELERDAWVVGCDEDDARGVFEHTRAVAGAPVPFDQGDVGELLLSSHCSRDAVIRLSAPALGGEDLLLSAF